MGWSITVTIVFVCRGGVKCLTSMEGLAILLRGVDRKHRIDRE